MFATFGVCWTFWVLLVWFIWKTCFHKNLWQIISSASKKELKIYFEPIHTNFHISLWGSWFNQRCFETFQCTLKRLYRITISENKCDVASLNDVRNSTISASIHSDPPENKEGALTLTGNWWVVLWLRRPPSIHPVRLRRKAESFPCSADKRTRQWQQGHN